MTAMDMFHPLEMDLDADIGLEEELVHRYLIS